MSIDITYQFEKAAAGIDTWTSSDVWEALKIVTTARPSARVDWEPGDEEWARVVDSEVSEILALICAKIPLGFIRSDIPTSGSTGGLVWITVPSTDESVYKISPEVLDRIFGRTVSRNLNYDAISADDVWWATV
jgi:hypothetical protein